MRVTKLEIKQFRSFLDSGPIELGQINVLVGANNSGKSSVLRALHLLQDGHSQAFPDVRVGQGEAAVSIYLENISDVETWGGGANFGNGLVTVNITTKDRSGGGIRYKLNLLTANSPSISSIPNIDPRHFIVPFFSRRKTAGYGEDVRKEFAHRVNTDMSNLAAKLSRVASPSYPKYQAYSTACKKILGFIVAGVPSENGQRPGVYLPDGQSVPIDQMGDGVPHIVTLLADLALSDGKLFLIEEPENDLHPEALKTLLDLIVKSAASNQFVISTHSNIVVRHLASQENCKLLSVSSELGILPAVATIREIDSTVEARMGVLRELGYSLSDFDLWEGWLILEEASAERIIRDYLIPWFAPKLSCLRTLSSRGVSRVAPVFEDFRRMVCFAHLEEIYRKTTWVRVDGDKDGVEIVKQLHEAYPSWKDDNFGCFSQEAFEYYYPATFAERAKQVLEINDKRARQEAKKTLSADVRSWLNEDAERGRTALEESAAEVISFLKVIERKLINQE